jgi:hypothetical protein
MTRAKLDTWTRFERWAYRYKKVCDKVIEEIAAGVDIDELFLQKAYELHSGLILDWSKDESELSGRIDSRVNFIRGYLANISFDGPQFMSAHSKFLPLQYPSRCNNAFCVWLDQESEGELESGSYFGFQEFDVSFFCNSLDDIDLASMRSVVAFNRMTMRRPKGRHWDTVSVNEAVKRIKYDLEFDYSVETKADGDKSDELFFLKFTWGT